MFSTQLKKLRKEKGLTQAELAEKFGLKPSILGMYENNRRMPEVKTLSAMADFFNVTTDYLLGKTNLREHFIANKLKSIRAERTIEDYSHKLGISSNLLKSFEEGKEIPSKGILDYIAEIEGIDPNYFFESSKIDEPIPNKKVSKIFSNEIENWLKTENCKEYIEFIYKAYKQGISKEMLKKADINIKIT